jgi:hypothetical protein
MASAAESFCMIWQQKAATNGNFLQPYWWESYEHQK